MKRVAALLTVVLLALPLTAAAQTAQPPKPPESVDDLKGPLRLYFAKMNTVYRALCEHALKAQDEPSLQKILDQVDDLFLEQAETVKQALDDLRYQQAMGAGISFAKSVYGKNFAALIVLEQVRERVRGCVGIAVNNLRQPGVTAGTGSGGGGGTGGGAGGQGPELCQSQAGPLGCTGSFSGMYQGECGDGSGPRSRDASPGSITFFADGTVTLRLQGGTSALNGRVDSTGRVSILEEGLHRADIGDGFSQRWEGRFSVQPAPGGGSRVVGGGTYESRLTGPQGELQNACKGTFTLSGPPS